MMKESNPAPIPFSITPEAEGYLRERLNEMPSKARLVLMVTMCQTDGLKPPRWNYEGQSFIIAYSDAHEKNEAEFIEFELFGRRVAIEANALKQLAGQTLDLRRVASSRGLMKNNRYVLVANSVRESSSLHSRAGVSAEQMKRRISIAAMTILGGFTGMGVFWMGFCIVTILLRIQFEKYLPLTFPLFVTGWIAGAFISFFFFRSLLATSGKTTFCQEKRERKYLGYGGLEAELDWWVFFGIPMPLTAILIFSIEPFAHTVAEKTAVAVGAIVVVFAMCMYFGDRIPQRFIFRLGILGWLLTFALGFWYFKTYGP